MDAFTPVILCGGSGTRLWPLSRERHPKQFVDLGQGRTLFGDALERVTALFGAASPIISCNEKYRFFVRDELKKRGVAARIILEPNAKNTAPAVALTALSLLEAGDAAEPVMAILPSDHELPDWEVFSQALEAGRSLAEEGKIVALGIEPLYPATGFGYISTGEPLQNGFTIKKFVEKPDLAQATAMLEDGGFFWNAGIYLMKPSVYLEELKRQAPKMLAACENAWKNRTVDSGFECPSPEAFAGCPENSIDYTIMENTERGVVTPLKAKWNDLGSWDAFFRDVPRDANGNACQGDVLLVGAKGCQVHSHTRLVAATGVEDLTIVETRDAVLVTRRGKDQGVKAIVEGLKNSGRYQYQRHPIVFRPWGSFETLALGDRFQVKRLTVNPGETLSLQLHHHRAEHWVIVQGTAQITIGDDSRLYTENQSTYIPLGQVHRLHNPGRIPLILIEIQSGSYLGEDDLVRLEDAYGRAGTKPEEI